MGAAQGFASWTRLASDCCGSYLDRMKHLLAIACLPLLVACSGGNETPAESPGTPERIEATASASPSVPVMADRLIDDGKILSEMLSRVNSPETAEDVRPAIEAMIEEYRQLLNTMDTMDSPNFSDMAALASRAKPLADTQRRVATEIQRIYTNHPEAADILREALDDLGNQ